MQISVVIPSSELFICTIAGAEKITKLLLWKEGLQRLPEVSSTAEGAAHL